MEQRNPTQTENSNQEKWGIRQSKLKAFEVIQKNLATAGITSFLADQSYPLNWPISFGFLMLSSGIYNLSIFIIYDAETFPEYTQAVYGCSLVTLIILALLIFILNVAKLFEFISSTNDLVNTSELDISNTFYYTYPVWWHFSWLFSSKILSIEVNFHWSRSFRTQIEQHHLFCRRKDFTSTWFSAIFLLLQSPLFHDRFGANGISITISSAVRMHTQKSEPCKKRIDFFGFREGYLGLIGEIHWDI